MIPSPSANWTRGSALTPPPAPALPSSSGTNTLSDLSSTFFNGNVDNAARSAVSGSAAGSTNLLGPRPIKRPTEAHIALAPQQVTTTIVTTTTTRTTDYPPLYIPQPPSAQYLDPQTYPLSNTPTPPAFKKFCFDFNGIPTSFRELELLEQDLSSIQGNPSTAQSSPTPRARQPFYTRSTANFKLPTNRKRPISPENIAAMTSTELEASATAKLLSNPGEGRARAPKRRGSIGASSMLSQTFRGVGNDGHHITPLGKPMLGGGPIPVPLTPFPESNPVDIPGAAQTSEAEMAEATAPNLPSPTASPTTQAHFPEDMFGTEQPLTITRKLGETHHGTEADTRTETYTIPGPSELPPGFSDIQSLGEIPHILHTFDGLPVPLKSYLLLQLLRRCPFPTLQFVSSLILPSLKRDFIGLLPVELSYQILQYLDLRSLGKCSSVSKSWKRVVDGDGAELAVWKKRLQSEGWYDEAEVRREVGIDNKKMASKENRITMEDSDDDDGINHPVPINGKQGRFDWPADWHAYGELLNNRRATEPFPEGTQLPPHLYKNLYRKHHLIRQNWFHGRYKHISFPGHAFNVVTCLQFDAEKIVSGSDDQTIHIYDTNTGQLRKRLEGHEGGVWALQYWNNVLVSGSTDRTVRVWDMDAGSCTHLFEGHTSTVRCLIIIIPYKNPETGRMEPECPLIVTGSRDATLRVWKLPHPKRDNPYIPTSGTSSPTDGSNPNPFFKYVLQGHTNSVRAIAGYGNVLVSGSYDTSVRIWNLATGECAHICRAHREKVYSVGYSHELNRAVSGSMDATVRVWCTKTGAQLFTLEGHTSLVGLLELSPQYLVSAAADATLRIWSPTTGQCLANLTGHSAAITCFHHDPKLNRIVSGSDGGVKVWELSSTGYGSGQPPAGVPFAPALPFTQGPNGPQPVHGRFIRDLVGGVQGVWRVRMDEQRLVCAVQKEGGRTWFEVLDFTEGVDGGVTIEGPGDEDGGSESDVSDVRGIYERESSEEGEGEDDDEEEDVEVGEAFYDGE